MPVNSNVAIQNQATVAWDGAVGAPADVSKHIRFAWSFEVMVALGADAVFNIQTAMPSAVDPCVPGPFSDVPEISSCSGAAVGGVSTVTIPLATAVGSVCSGTIPCRPGAFVRLVSVAAVPNNNTSFINAVLIRQGPMGL